MIQVTDILKTPGECKHFTVFYVIFLFMREFWLYISQKFKFILSFMYSKLTTKNGEKSEESYRLPTKTVDFLSFN